MHEGDSLARAAFFILSGDSSPLRVDPPSDSFTTMRYSYVFILATVVNSLSSSVAAQLEEPAQAETSAETPSTELDSDKDATTPVKVRHGTLSVDPLGFLLFGPTVNAEAAIGQVGIGAGFRWFSPGLLANKLFLNDGSHFAFSYGIALRGTYYFLQPLAGPHVGLAVELLHTRAEDDDARIATISTYLIPQIEGGYRLALRRFLIGGTAAVGYAVRAGSKVENLPGGTNADRYTVVNESSFYGTARLDLGFYF